MPPCRETFSGTSEPPLSREHHPSRVWWGGVSTTALALEADQVVFTPESEGK
jgi:hypothetical protein